MLKLYTCHLYAENIERNYSINKYRFEEIRLWIIFLEFNLHNNQELFSKCREKINP
jgi:hypothetical protein